MQEKKYLLCPGNIHSWNDNDIHYISAIKLKDLYKVSMNECLILNNRISIKRAENEYQNLYWLIPLVDGQYIIPKEKGKPDGYYSN